MTDNKNICEEIQIAILSDDELSDIQKEHIENCEECRALLSQVTQMKNDLGSIALPGIEEGRITKAVMETIKKEKTSVPFPKFKFTHHLGTAAAIAIILIAALMIKNPSEMDKNSVEDNTKAPVSFDEAQNNHVLSGVSVTEETEEKILHRAFTDKVQAAETEDGADEEAIYDYGKETAVNDVLQTKKASPVYDTSDDVPLSYGDGVDSYNDASAVDVTESAPMLFSVSMENTEQMVSDLQDDINEKTSFGSSGGGGAGGGSGNGSGAVLKSARPSAGGGSLQDEESTEAPTEESAQTESEWAEEVIAGLENSETQSHIFEGIEFEHGEDKLDYNISLANDRLSELYGGEYVISKEKLILLGLDNEKFIKLANSITKEMFLFYKEAFDIFE